MLAERGRNLSQGQRQLLAFARVLATDPEILVLDEATASIDSETEAEIQAALKRLRADRTTVIIAHRLATIVDADQVLVLVNGTQRPSSLETVLMDSPTYARMHRLQFEEGETLEGEAKPQPQPRPGSGAKSFRKEVARRASSSSKFLALRNTSSRDRRAQNAGQHRR